MALAPARQFLPRRLLSPRRPSPRHPSHPSPRHPSHPSPRHPSHPSPRLSLRFRRTRMALALEWALAMALAPARQFLPRRLLSPRRPSPRHPSHPSPRHPSHPSPLLPRLSLRRLSFRRKVLEWGLAGVGHLSP